MSEPVPVDAHDGRTDVDQDCVIAGGGPAGIMLGLLLARAGLRVTVLEKHPDFNRDFRGDTVHPSTIRALDELGLGEKFRALKQDVLGDVSLPFGPNGFTTIGAFSTLPAPYNYVALVPQWDLLDFLADAASEEPTFTLVRNARVIDVIRSEGQNPRALGLIYQDVDGEEHRLTATLTVGADGRHSVVRERAQLSTIDYPVPFDAWWFALPRTSQERGAPPGLAPAFGRGTAILSFDRDTYYQVALLAAKGRDAEFRAEGIGKFRDRVAEIRGELAPNVQSLSTMDDVHHLSVTLNRARQWWRPGLLLIGDAAHAMSPAGGVGINLAFQDALAAARILKPALVSGTLGEGPLKAVQRRRTLPTVLIQGLQRALHRLVFTPLFLERSPRGPRAVAWVLQHVPALSRVAPRMIGFGPRPEHAPDWARPPRQI